MRSGLSTLGSQQRFPRCLVLSVPAVGQERALVTVVTHTTSCRGGRFEVGSDVQGLKRGVFDAQSLVTIPEAKLIKCIGTLSPAGVARVEGAVRAWLGFQEEL